MDGDSQKRISGPIAILLLFLALAVTAALLVPHSGGGPDDRRHWTIADVANLKSAVSAFSVDNGRFPRNDEGLAALMNAPSDLVKTWQGPYLFDVSQDSWGHPYHYVCPASGKDGFNIISAGGDGEFGTADDIDIQTTN